MKITREPETALWSKDGRWHTTERYEPSLKDRVRYPVSYPASDPGPFFIWSLESFATEKEARQKIRRP